MSLRFEPVKVDTGSADQEGQLVFMEDLLVAVLVSLSDDHASDSGKWFLEAAFGRVVDPGVGLFEDLDAAQVWIEGRLLSGD